MVEEGIMNLRKAVELDQEYEDAMAYLQLLLRERADLAESTEGHTRDTKEADARFQTVRRRPKLGGPEKAAAGRGFRHGGEVPVRQMNANRPVGRFHIGSLG